MFLPIFCSPPCSKCMKRTFAQVVEKMKSTLETTRKIMYILVLCEFVRKYSNWTLKMVLVRDLSLVAESRLVLHRLLVSAPGQDKSGLRNGFLFTEVPFLAYPNILKIAVFNAISKSGVGPKKGVPSTKIHF